MALESANMLKLFIIIDTVCTSVEDRENLSQDRTEVVNIFEYVIYYFV